MSDQVESREEWENDVRDIQRSVTPAEGLRSAQVFSKRASATPAPIPDFGHFVRFLLSAAFLALGFFLLSSDISHNVALGATALAAGCSLGIAAFRWPHKRR